MLREFARESRILRRLYHDEMDIFRVKFKKDEDTLETIQEEVCIYRKKRCGLSQASNDAPDRDTITSVASDTFTIFADVEVQMQENDRVVVRTADGPVYEGRTGKTFPIRSHGETPLKVEKVS